MRKPTSEEHIWWGDVNVPMSLENYKGLRQRMLAYLQGKELFVQDVYAGADRDYRTCIRIISPEGLQADLNLQLKAYLEMA